MDQTNATLLLVDDDAMNRDALSRRLTRKGYTVLTAESGARAIETVNARRVDAVLLDVMMPGMSGIETLRRLRESHSVSELPVIMVTANDRSEDVVDALDLGANDYVTKPIDFPVVLARIRTQVTARRADPLTGLPNRVLFMDRLDRLMTRARTPGGASFAVLFLDIDRFKIVNDSMGHLAGDELLIGIARRLEQTLRSTDTVSILRERDAGRRQRRNHPRDRVLGGGPGDERHGGGRRNGGTGVSPERSVLRVRPRLLLPQAPRPRGRARRPPSPQMDGRLAVRAGTLTR